MFDFHMISAKKHVYKSWKFEHKLPRKKAIKLFFCDLDIWVSGMKAVCNTPSSDGAYVYEVSLNYLERFKSYGKSEKWTDGQTVFELWPWTVTMTLEWGWWKRLVMIHVSMKFRHIIFSGSEVTVRPRTISKECNLYVWPLPQIM
jgi:hypothetical protein